MAKIIGLGDNVIDCNYTDNRMYPGGNSFNFAMYGRQLGHETAYAGTIAKDWQGTVITDTLSAEGVDISHCQYVDGETGICGIHLVDGDRRIVDENDAGAVKSHPLLIDEALVAYIKGFDLVHCGCYGYLESQLPVLRGANVPILYDFSDEWQEDTLRRICPGIDIAFFSGKDLSEELLRDMLKLCVEECGCRMAVTTMGERGAIVYNGRRYYQKLPYNFEAGVVDTTGAGDSWITAFMTTYVDHMKISDALHADRPEHFTREEDRSDFEDRLIELAMCAGNLLARRNCLVAGSVGHGIRLEERR